MTAQRIGFNRTREGLLCDAVPVERIAKECGTPVYIYSASAIRDQYARLEEALGKLNHRLHYSVKANSNLAILKLLKELGAGVDIVSGGELYRALLAGFKGSDIVFSGVGKTEREMEEALRADVLLFNVESDQELQVLAEVAQRMNTRARVALRVNPEVMVDTPHPYTRTGGKGMKFGIAFDEALIVAAAALNLSSIELVGLDMHVGSQISQLAPYEAGLNRLLHLRTEIERSANVKLEYLDMGGGLAVSYESNDAMDVEAFGKGINTLLGDIGMRVLLEPGRFLVGNAGALVTRVLYRKRSGGKNFIITDAGMNDLLRPSHYNAYHRIEAVGQIGVGTIADVVGPVCESGDFFAIDRQVDDVVRGDLIAVHSAGAYGFVMASNYNSRPRPSEVLVDGSSYTVVTRRETYEDLVRAEQGGG
ncbi:MAG: diaminopimelate decarboxylase [Gemmatimonadaceae bacterium]|nr:diaminopimelate decarboxylase [Gemmatimonadaceae bacterium]